MAINDERYSVGWGKPPRHTRFKKGQSGNPKGRPKGSKNLATVFNQVLNQRVTVRVDGSRRTITKLLAFVTQVVNQAASGDRRSAQLLLNQIHLMQRNQALYPAQPPEPTEHPYQLSDDEKVEWATELTRILRDLGQLDEMK